MFEEKQNLLEEKRGSVLILTLNRPDHANSLDRKLVKNLRDTFERIKWDESIKAVILTGSGNKNFCAGIDLQERSNMSDDELLLYRYRERELLPSIQSLAEFPKPIIGAINGTALGGGAELALTCDIRIGASNASFGQTEIQWGIIPSGGACQRLRVVAGLGVAKELIFTGKVIEAEEAYRLGIYNRIVALKNLMPEALQLGNEIAQNSPLAVKQAKKVIDFGTGISVLSTFDFEASKECFYRGQAFKRPEKFQKGNKKF